jgi:DNA primase
MKFPPGILDEIRARLPVSEVVGKRVRLQKAGREWKGLSPFNAEKTPSFFVNDQKGFFHDFSSGKHGDIFGFVMETEGLSFPEAVERLAGLAGVELPRQSREAEEQDRRYRSLGEVMTLACAFFQEQLRAKPGFKARAYCEGRGLGPEVRDRFGLGYAPPDRFALRDHLAGKGVTSDAMIEAGLLVTGNDIAVPYDRFRDRLMFPIADVRGRVIAFGGRALEKDVPAKYLNSPDTPLFHKGTVLYNHHNARKAAHDKGTVIAVEGYVDVIGMTMAGFANTVAPLGTALTQDQLALLWRMADEPILCFDGDKAGRRAAYRAIDTALPLLEPGRSLRFALLPEGQDPDDLARSGGASAVARVVERATSLVDLLWAREVESSPLDTPERRAALERRMREIMASVRHEDLRRHYRDEIASRLSTLFAPVRRQAGGGGRGRDQRGGGRYREPGRFAPAEPARASESLARSALFARHSSVSPREALILSILLAHPELLSAQAEALASLDFSHADTRALQRAIGHAAAVGALEDGGVVPSALGLEAEYARLAAAVSPSVRWCLDSAADPVAVREILRQAMTLHRRARTLHNELGLAEVALAEDPNESNLAWVSDLRMQISALEGTEAEVEGAGRAPGARGA